MELTAADSGRDSAKTLVTRRGRRGSAGVVTQAPGGAPEGPKVEVGKAFVGLGLFSDSGKTQVLKRRVSSMPLKNRVCGRWEQGKSE